jgi:hypothetical protein
MFFVLSNALSGATTDFLPADGSRTGDAPQCTVCGRYVGMRPLVPPIRVEVKASGEKWGDVAFGPSDGILVSSRFRAAFLKAGLVGLTRTDSVEIVTAKSRHRIGNPPAYYLASIIRGRAAIDDSASGIVRERANVCYECRTGGLIKRATQIVIEDGTWSGEDLFYARGLPGTIISTERVKELCTRQKLQNCNLIPAADFSFDFYP